MYKTIAILFIVLFSTYIFFTRHPDYLDGELAPATIHFSIDAATKQTLPFANYAVSNKTYSTKADYPLRNFQEGEKVRVIYESATPNKAAVYHPWGYWILWDELLGGIIIYLVMFFVAVNITNNPNDNA